MPSSFAKLFELLRELSGQTFNREVDMARFVIPRLAEALGYSEPETFYEFGSPGKTADVVFSSSIESRPWIVIDLKVNASRNPGDWAYQLKRYLSAFHCPIGVVLSPEFFFLVRGDHTKRFTLSSITLGDSEEIFDALRRSTQPAPGAQQQTVCGRLVELIEKVEVSETTEEKGKSLENLARFLLDGVPSLTCKYSNLRTRSSEIDIIVEYNSAKRRIPLCDELGRYFLVECKNWSKPVGVGPVRDFMGKLEKCRIQLGVIFSKNGVTGVDSGADALREIHSSFDRNGVYLLVFSLEDLRSVDSSEAFVETMDRKADSLRFDAACS